jgi:enoyl-CoA hydratase/carnithine racemase
VSRYQRIHIAREGGALRITLAYPPRRNAIGPLMIDELLDVLANAEADDSVRAIVITGEGPVFSSGGDFMQWNPSLPEGRPSERDLGVVAPSPPVESHVPARGDYGDLILALLRSTRPVIARVNGHAFGSGLGIVMASTFSVALPDAQFGTPEIHAGLFPMMILPLLERVVPTGRLYQMMLFGEKLEANEAAALGIVTRLAEPGELDECVSDWLARIESKSSMTVRLGMRAFAEQRLKVMEPALRTLRGAFAELLMTDDAREGLLAFLEKRQPFWTGR